jgi:hypothetical protein
MDTPETQSKANTKKGGDFSPPEYQRALGTLAKHL